MRGCDGVFFHVTSGKLNVIGTTGGTGAASRNLAIAAQGFNVNIPNWLALYTPNGTPQEKITAISRALQEIQEDPTFRSTMMKALALPVSRDMASAEGVELSLRIAAGGSR